MTNQKNYAELNPIRQFEYTFAAVDETTRTVKIRCFCNYEGLMELLNRHTSLDQGFIFRLMEDLVKTRYVEYAGSSNGSPATSVYISYLGDPKTSKTLFDLLNEDVYH